MRSFAAAVVAVAAISLLLAGSASPGTVAAQPTTKAHFAKQMNSLCATAHASVSSLPAAKTMAEAASVGAKLDTAEQSLIRQLEKLKPPAALKPHVSRFISVLKTELALNDAVVSAAKSNNSAAFQKAAAAANYENQSEQAAVSFEARVIGAPACAAA
jgi:hypothetical protein